ncbi:family 16 glycosylhydrolase [Cerasicoccus fimbriatus]|uniref:golvesin C-terminal-like domain-containing protein n=1 Tax=Cerasicoccus fimbriatus TaxID=3014554 RepID=UPI0022B3552D|nr:family 16 glycosylhydrolase [Cerasicoccus sp. TK19100]
MKAKAAWHHRMPEVLTALSILVASPTIFAQTTITIDNADTSGISLVGSWNSSTGVSGYYGSNYLHDNSLDKGLKSATFTPDIQVADDYEVFLRWTSGSGRPDNVPVNIIYEGGTSQTTVNQQINGGMWNSIGVYSFAAGTSGHVKIETTGTSDFVIVDAIQFVPQSVPALTDIIIDSTDSEAIKTGTWSSSTAASGYYGSNYLQDGATGKGAKSVAYIPDIPELGLYDIFLRWTDSSNRSEDTPYTVYSADGVTGFLADQTQNGGEWVPLGGFVLDAGMTNEVVLSTEGTDGKHVIADAVRFTEAAPYEVIVDNSDTSLVTIEGDWFTSTSATGYVGNNYLHDDASAKGSKSITFAPELDHAGSYDVYMNWAGGGTRSDQVPVHVTWADGVTPLYVNQQTNSGQWNYIGTYSFISGNRGTVTITTEDTDGLFVLADAVKFVRTAAEWTPETLGDRLWYYWNVDDLPDGAVEIWDDRIVGLKGIQSSTTYPGEPQGDNSKQPIKQNGELYISANSNDHLKIKHLDGSPYLPHIAHRAVVVLFRVDLTGTGGGTLFAINGYGGGLESQPSVQYNRDQDRIGVNWRSISGSNGISFTIDPDGSTWHCLVARREDKYIYASIDGKDINGNPGETQIEMQDWAVADSNIFNQGIIGDFRSNNPEMALDTIILTQQITGDEADRLMGWAMWRRGIQDQLPTTHPYRYRKPYATAPIDQFYEVTEEAWQATNNFWSDASLSEDPYVGDPIDLTGWSLDFEDEFNTHSVTHDVLGKGNWFAPTHQAAVGERATNPIQYDEENNIIGVPIVGVPAGVGNSDRTVGTPAYHSNHPDTYIHGNSEMTIRMQKIDDEWYSGCFASVNLNGYGRSWMYPYVEARMKIGPSSTGNYYGAWPALWLKSLNSFTNLTQTNIEYDIYEGYSADKKGHHATLHQHPGIRQLPGRQSSNRKIGNYYGMYTSSAFGIDDLFDGEFHTYGTMITPDWVINYFDGKELHRFPTPQEMKQPMWILVDLAMNGPSESLLADGIYELTVDYVRVYQNPTYSSE